MVLNIHGNHKAYSVGTRRRGVGVGGMEVGDNIPVATLSPLRMTPALRWAATDESHFNISLIARDRPTSQDSVHKPQLLKSGENRAGGFEPRSVCLTSLRLTARPNRLTLMTTTWCPRSRPEVDVRSLSPLPKSAALTRTFFISWPGR